MSTEIKRTVRGTFDGLDGMPELNKVFSNAEKWTEFDIGDNDHLVCFRFFVRHPHYPKCKMVVEQRIGAQGPEITRTISDTGFTPVSAISQLARYTTLAWGQVQRRRGGPEPTPEADKIRIVRGWRQVKGKIKQQAYAQGQWITARTLRTWEKELEEEGKL